MNDLQQYLIDEFVEDYQDGQMARRDALHRIAAITGSMALATSILAACGAPRSGGESSESASGGEQPTLGATDVTVNVDPNDPAIEAGSVEFAGDGATLLGYLARPSGDGPFPVVLVAHENRGLTPHIEDVARRLGKAGYVGLAVDLLSRQGGTAAIGDPAQVPGILGNTPPEQFITDFESGLTYLQSQSYVAKDRVGMVGFCFGGGVTWRAATKLPQLRAAVPFYGPHPPLEDVPAIQAAVLAIYGELDERINKGIPQIEAAMQQHNKTFVKIIYPDAQHAFHNDTGRNYKLDAARDAWAKTLDWFARYLQA